MGLSSWKSSLVSLRDVSSNPTAQNFQQIYSQTEDTIQFTLFNVKIHGTPLLETKVHIYMSYVGKRKLSKITE